MKILAILLTLLATGPALTPPQFNIIPAEKLGKFMVFGRITDGFEAEMQLAIARNPKLKRVEIDSRGGLNLEARRTAKLLNEHNISIRVVGTCASACVLLWAATNQRELMPSARLGIHAGRPNKKAPGPLEILASRTRKKIADDMLHHAGFPDQLIAKGHEVPNNSILWLTPNELAAAGVKFALIGPAT